MVTYPHDWITLTLGDCLSAKAEYGINAPAIPFTYAYPQYIRITDINDDGRFNQADKKSVAIENENKYILKEDDIVIARTGASTGKSYLYNSTDGRLAYAGFLIRFPINTLNHDARYIAYQLRTSRYWEWISTMSMRSGQPGINKKEYSTFPLPIPSKPEQKAIAATLTQFDELISSLDELIEKKRNIREGAIEELITGKERLAGFSDEWITVSFDKVITPKARIGWQGLKKDEYLQHGYSYLIGGSDFINGSVNLDGINFVSKQRYELDANIQVSENDVLVTKDGTVGKVAIVQQLDRPATLNSGVFVFRTNERLDSRFLYRLLSSSVFKNFIAALSAGSTIKHLYQKDLKRFSFDIPKDIEEQTAIADVLEKLDSDLSALEVERDKWKQIRDGAMDDLLTGRVRLQDWEV